MLTTTGHRLPGAPGRLVTETAVWGALIVLAAIGYVVAGGQGFVTTLNGQAFTTLATTLREGEFDNAAGSISLLIVIVLTGAGLFIPTTIIDARSPRVHKLGLGGSALVLAVLLIVLSLFPSAWLTWVTALVLGLVVGLQLALTPFTNEKPWRRAGVPAAVLAFIACIFQILGGAAAGTRSLGWMSLLVAATLIVGVVIVYLTPERALHADASTTGAFPTARARLARPAAEVSRPWVCTALFAVLGTVIVLAQPTVVVNDFGQAGFALIIVCSLIGWAIGFEMGPTFAPGMSRPRVSAFALTVSGLLLVLTGAISEVSGTVVLSAVISFLVGIGVRSQHYTFSRRVGAIAGGLIALAINALDLSVVVPLGEATWPITSSEVAYGVMGLAALVAGIVGLCIFDPHGLQGLSVDIVHGFRPPNAESSAQGIGTVPERFGQGFFIAIEGGDGSGKSTQIKQVSAALADAGFAVESTREPGGTELGRKIRSVLFDAQPPSPRAEALLFAADRAHHISTLVDPSLDDGGIVITDRYIDSTLAYQAAGRQFDEKTILGLSRWATQGLVPHLTIVLDIDPDTAAQRLGERGEANYLDDEDRQFHQRVRQTYLSRARKNPDRYVVVDAAVPADELTATLLEIIRPRLPQTAKTGSATPTAVKPNSVQSSVAPVREPVDTEHEMDGASAAGAVDSAEEAKTTVLGAVGVDSQEESDDEVSTDTAALAAAAIARGPGPDSVELRGPRPESLEIDDEELELTERINLGSDLRPDADDDLRTGDDADRRVGGEDAVAILRSTVDEVAEEAAGTEEAAGEAETTVLPAQAASPVNDDAETTVLPVRTARQLSREKLLAQAEIERQARERLRQQRERNRNRLNDPEGRK